MVKFEDFSKQTLIEVIRQKLWNREKETLLECSRIEYRIKHKKISKEVDGLISENQSLSTSLTDMVKWRENQKKINALFKQQESLHKDFEKQSADIRMNYKDGC